MTKQNYLRTFTATFTKLVEAEAIMKKQKKVSKDLYKEYLKQPIGSKGTTLLLEWSKAMSLYSVYFDTYLDLVKEFRNIKKSFTY